MLLDQTFVLQEGWQKIPLVLGCIYRCIDIFLIVEGLEGGIEAVTGWVSMALLLLL